MTASSSCPRVSASRTRVEPAACPATGRSAATATDDRRRRRPRGGSTGQVLERSPRTSAAGRPDEASLSESRRDDLRGQRRLQPLLLRLRQDEPDRDPIRRTRRVRRPARVRHTRTGCHAQCSAAAAFAGRRFETVVADSRPSAGQTAPGGLTPGDQVPAIAASDSLASAAFCGIGDSDSEAPRSGGSCRARRRRLQDRCRRPSATRWRRLWRRSPPFGSFPFRVRWHVKQCSSQGPGELCFAKNAGVPAGSAPACHGRTDGDTNGMRRRKTRRSRRY